MKNKLKYLRVFMSTISHYDFTLSEIIKYSILGIIPTKKSQNGIIFTKLDEFIIFQMIPAHGGKKVLADKFIYLNCINHYSKIMSGNLSHKFLFEKNLTTNCQKSINTALYHLNEGVNL